MVRMGVIGYGYWGPNLVRNFMELEGSEVAAVADRDAKRLEALARRWPAVKGTTRAEEVIADPSIQAVVIATPVASHHELALAALRAGKHVLVEKPLAQTAAQARELVEEAERRGLVLLVDHTFLYTGAVQKIRELAAAGELGQIYYYDSVRVNLGLFQEDVDVIWDLAVHDLSIMDFVLGVRPVAVHASGIRHVEGQHTNMAYLTLRFDEPMLAHVHVNWLAPMKVRRTLIGGSKKMIVYDDLDMDEKVRVYDKGITLSDQAGEEKKSVYKMVAYRRTGDLWAPKLRMTEALEVEARHFLACVRGEETPISDGRSGLRMVEMLEAATRSLQQGGVWVDLPR